MLHVHRAEVKDVLLCPHRSAATQETVLRVLVSDRSWSECITQQVKREVGQQRGREVGLCWVASRLRGPGFRDSWTHRGCQTHTHTNVQVSAQIDWSGCVCMCGRVSGITVCWGLYLSTRVLACVCARVRACMSTVSTQVERIALYPSRQKFKTSKGKVLCELLNPGQRQWLLSLKGTVGAQGGV